MLPNITSKSLTAASANCIAQGQSVVAGANAIINGASATAGAFTLDTQRRVVIVSSGNDSAKTAIIRGNRGTGQQISEVLALTNVGTAVSVLDYFSGGTVTFPQGTTGTITIGTNTTGSTDWIVPNYNMTPFSLNANVGLVGSATWNFETTNDRNFWDPPKGLGATTPQPNVNGYITNSATAQVVTVTAPITGYRITITAGTGSVNMQAVQAGITNM